MVHAGGSSFGGFLRCIPYLKTKLLALPSWDFIPINLMFSFGEEKVGWVGFGVCQPLLLSWLSQNYSLLAKPWLQGP